MYEELIKETIQELEEKHSKPLSEGYWEMLKNHAEKLDKIHEKGKKAPWEWSFGLDYLVEFMREMRDYYARGENVWAVEEKGQPSRFETLNLTLSYYDKWQNLDEEYIKVIEHGEPVTHEGEDGSIIVEDLGYHCEYKYKPKGKSKRAQRRAIRKTYKKLHKEESKYKKLFFNSLNKYIETWWD